MIWAGSTYKSSYNLNKVFSLYRVICMFLLLLFTNTLLLGQNGSTQNYFEQGVKEKNSGNVESALDIWYEAKSTLEEPDFRISHAYMRLVTDRGMKDYYQKASELYEWGLSGNIDDHEEDALLLELDLIRPLIDNRDYRRFKKEIRQKNPDILSDLSNFWNSLDPTPLRSYNERLLEHWERIAYAEKNYSRGSVGEFDDRAYTYIKYGSPFYTKKGTLKYKASLVNMLLKDGIEVPSFASMNDEIVAHEQRLHLESRIRQLHSYPNFEVWIYTDLTESPQNTIFMFGTRDGTSSFRKINSVDDFIPNEAYRTIGQSNYSSTFSDGSQNREGVQLSAGRMNRDIKPKINISPALILQLMYYDQFAALDDYFGKSYNEMMDRYTDRSNTLKTGLAREFSTMFGDELLHIQNSAPIEKSEYEDEVMSISTDNYVYRFLDEKNQPVIKVYSVSNFEEALHYDLLKKRNSLVVNGNSPYLLLSGYMLTDNSNETLQEVVNKSEINSIDPEVRVFDIPVNENFQHILISHELHSIDDYTGSIAEHTSFPKSLKGLYNGRFIKPEPLPTENLVLSDIIIGYGDFDETELSLEIDSDPTFTIAHEKEIPINSDLVLYYELYNLEPLGMQEVAEYRFQYSIEKRNAGLFKKNDDPISITLNNKTQGSRDKNLLTIDTSEFSKGDYRLEIMIVDINSGEDFTKTLDFKIN